MLDLNDVALFVQVARQGSFAEAGRRLGLPPNTVSRRVQQLEDALGSRLLQRSTRKLSLTSAGEAFYQRCAAAVDGLLDAGQALASAGGEPSGLIRVAATADFFDFLPMEWVAEFLDAHPRVRIEFALSDARADLIAERIDVAFRGGELADSNYVSRRLPVSGNAGLVASPAYLDRRGAPATLAELATHDCVTGAAPGERVAWKLLAPDGSEQEALVGGRFRGNTAQAQRRAALAGLGIALLPPALARLDLAAGRLLPVLPGHRRPGAGLSVLYPSRKHLPAAVSAFVAMVVEKLEGNAPAS
ncbi:LysR family transcriptional regulator [Chromobacterium phragmitis]|uniref:LysR family transcriptional regulator n=1 Tax=Chromobacterium phragmitis TaxID=2202141 RepID=A0A344UFB7_9NEIS|nr:LysR family transcriptional regulator [Chromobacterium phragmitis]AXE33965.1 LysR family transcriptional regulator [Chromobacterium phragmitis]